MTGHAIHGNVDAALAARLESKLLDALASTHWLPQLHSRKFRNVNDCTLLARLESKLPHALA